MCENQNGTRNLAPYAKAVLALKMEDAYSRIALDRKAQGGRGGIEEDVQNSAHLNDDGKTRTKLAKQASMSHDTLAKIKRIQSTATPELIQKMMSGEISIHAGDYIATLPEKSQKVRTGH